jgi:uncharacterized membrane protein YphA (DoxX/SURF4 family)
MSTAKRSAIESARAFPDAQHRASQIHMPQPNQLSNGSASNARGLAFLRIAVGILFLIFGEYKVFGTQFTLHGGFEFWINKFIQEGGAYPFMVPILKNFVLPHAVPIAFLVAYSEFAIGLACTFGILVRLASAGGLIFMLTLQLSSDYPGAGAPFWQYFGAGLSHFVFALCFIAFLIAGPNIPFSINALRRKALP